MPDIAIPISYRMKGRARTSPGPTVANHPSFVHFAFVNAVLAAEISRLTASEKLQLVDKLWDDFAANEDRLPVPPLHDQILAEDEAPYRADPTDGSSWPEAKARISGRS